MTIVTRSPASSANYSYPSTSGVHAWTLTGPAQAYIFANMPQARSLDLVFSGFDFASQIPAGAQIDGIQLNYVGNSDLVATDYRVVLRVGTGPDSANRAKAGNWPGSSTSRTYGSTDNDTWGLAAANPGMTLAEIVRAADFSAAIQINNPFGDPEDLARTYVIGFNVAVNWSLPATIAEGVMSAGAGLQGAPRGGSLVSGALADGATLGALGAPAIVVPGAFAGRAELIDQPKPSRAAPAVTPATQTTRLADRGSPTISITDSGSTEGGI